MNWFIPAFVSSSPARAAGSATRTARAVPRSSKNAGTSRGSRAAFTGGVYPAGQAAGGPGRSYPGVVVLRSSRSRSSIARLPLVDRFADQPAKVEDPPLSHGRRGRLRALHLLRVHRGQGDARWRPASPRRPRTAASLSAPSPCLLMPFLAGSDEMSFTSGLDAVFSTRPDIFDPRFPRSRWPERARVDASSSRLVRSTEVLISRSSGTVSSRIASIVGFGLSRPGTCSISTKHRTRTRPRRRRQHDEGEVAGRQGSHGVPSGWSRWVRSLPRRRVRTGGPAACDPVSLDLLSFPEGS